MGRGGWEFGEEAGGGEAKMRGCGGGMGWGRSPGWLDTTSGARYAGVPTRLVGALWALESLEKPKSASCSSRDRGGVVRGMLEPGEQGSVRRQRPSGLAKQLPVCLRPRSPG